MNEFFFSLSFSLSLFLSPQQGGVGCVFSCPCGSGAVPARSRRGPGAVSARFLPGFPETGGPCSRGGRLLLSNLNQRGQSDARTSDEPRILNIYCRRTASRIVIKIKIKLLHSLDYSRFKLYHSPRLIRGRI